MIVAVKCDDWSRQNNWFRSQHPGLSKTTGSALNIRPSQHNRLHLNVRVPKQKPVRTKYAPRNATAQRNILSRPSKQKPPVSTVLPEKSEQIQTSILKNAAHWQCNLVF